MHTLLIFGHQLKNNPNILKEAEEAVLAKHHIKRNTEVVGGLKIQPMPQKEQQKPEAE